MQMQQQLEKGKHYRIDETRFLNMFSSASDLSGFELFFDNSLDKELLDNFLNVLMAKNMNHIVLPPTEYVRIMISLEEISDTIFPTPFKATLSGYEAVAVKRRFI